MVGWPTLCLGLRQRLVAKPQFVFRQNLDDDGRTGLDNVLYFWHWHPLVVPQQYDAVHPLHPGIVLHQLHHERGPIVGQDNHCELPLLHLPGQMIRRLFYAGEVGLSADVAAPVLIQQGPILKHCDLSVEYHALFHQCVVYQDVGKSCDEYDGCEIEACPQEHGALPNCFTTGSGSKEFVHR